SRVDIHGLPPLTPVAIRTLFHQSSAVQSIRTLTPVADIKGHTQDWRRLMIQALSTQGDSLSTAHALSSGGPDPDRILDCLDQTTTGFEVSPATPPLDIGGRATLSWSIHPPRGCTMFHQVVLDGVSYGLSGSAVVQPLVTTSYPL